MHLLLLLLLVAACAHPGPPPEAAAGAAPRLVAPLAGVYAVRTGRPSDPTVSAAVGEAGWEESLSGAASGLALDWIDGRRPDRWRARWAALAAGYPYPVVGLAMDECPAGCPGTRVMDVLKPALRSGNDLGLARARGAAGDVWVGLVGRHTLALAAVPRQVARGARIVLEATPASAAAGAVVTVVPPDGDLEAAYLGEGLALVLDVPGAWWIRVDAVGGEVAGFPVYVDVTPPAETPLDPPLAPPASAGEAREATWGVLDEVRALLGREPLAEDALLAAAARAHLRDRIEPAAGPPSGPLSGPADACRASLACTLGPDEGPDACARAWLVDPERLARLTNPRCTLAGVAVAPSGARWIVQVEIGSS